MTITIAVTWFPRPTEVIGQAAQTWKGADFIIYPDCETDPPITGHPIKHLGENVGCFRHYYRVLSDLLRNTSTDLIGIIPDDVILSDGWADKVRAAHMGHGVGYTASYTPTGMTRLSTKVRFGKGWQEVKGGWGRSYGGCYVFSRSVAQRLIYHPFILTHHATYGKNQQIDAAIPEAMHRMGLKQLMHVPSLADHIGLTSTIGHKHTVNERGLNFIP